MGNYLSPWPARLASMPCALRVFVGKLRRKLGDDASSPRYVLTEPRVGYRMAKP